MKISKSVAKEMRHSTPEEQTAYENMLNKYSFPITTNFTIMDLDTFEGVVRVIKPTIIAICGKSCTGKSTLANFLNNYFNTHCRIPIRKILSDTTRPKRANEINGVDYNFVSEEEFMSRYNDGQYTCITQFRNWLYAIRQKQLASDNLYIGVFDPEGIKNLIRRRYNPIVVYLNEPLKVRLLRSRKREGRWRIEFFRRALKDFCDFLSFEKKYARYPYFLNLSSESNAAKQVGEIKAFLTRLGKIA